MKCDGPGFNEHGLTAGLVNEQELCNKGLTAILIRTKYKVNTCMHYLPVEIFPVPYGLASKCFGFIDQITANIGYFDIHILHQSCNSDIALIIFPNRIGENIGMGKNIASLGRLP